MRERLDCAIFELGDSADHHLPAAGVHFNGRLHLHRLPPHIAPRGDVRALAGAAFILQRFDACLIGVTESSLAQVRQLLLAAQDHLATPVIGLVHSLKAPAINDLFGLGMADFVRQPCCLEELRARTQRMLSRRFAARVHSGNAPANPSAVAEAGVQYASGGPGHNGPSDGFDGFVRAAASHCATSQESFRDAKGRVVACFEQAYLRASLSRSSGNITQAARSARKHRRAYWALMRKHGIDPAPFRSDAPAGGPQGPCGPGRWPPN